MGLRRVLTYWVKRLSRLPGSPRSVALGVAIGAAVCFTPLVGLQWAIALGLAWVCQASLIGATIGTFVANPWTYPLIWLSLYHLGQWILGHSDHEISAADISLDYLLKNPWDVFLPMMIGALPLAPLVAIVVYYPVRNLVMRRKKRRLRGKAFS